MRSLRFDWIGYWSKLHPGKVAVEEVESGRQLTYSRLNDLSLSLGHFFRNTENIRKGDRIGILAENALEHIILFGMAQKLGCILVPFNYRLTTAEISYLAKDSGVKTLVFSKTFGKRVSDLSTHLPSISTHSIASLWEVEEKEEPINADLEESDPIFILYTSGTTGFPKGAIYTHGMMFWNSVNTALALNLNQDSSTINCMPFFHTGGWNVLTTPMLHHGAKVYLSKKFDPSVIIDVIETKDITIFMGVPTMLKMMSEEPAFKEAEFASLLYILVGGEPMELAQIDLWHQKGVPIRQGYGMTEAGPNLTSLHHDDAVIKMGSIGRSNFYVQYKIVDDQGQVVDPDVPGELLLRGPIVTPGYWKNEKANADAFEEGWFKTGDRVLEDQDGYLFVVDRIKNMYISGGENVYPAEVERVIMEVDGVEEVAVIGVPNIKWGESGKAFYVSSHHVEVDEIISHCKSKLAKFKVPSEFQVLPSLPKTDTGKIDRGRLKELSKKKPARE